MLQLRDLLIGRGTFFHGPFTEELNQGDFVVLTGANGSGKTTLLETLAGTIPAIAGNVLLDGAPIRPALVRGCALACYVPDETGPGLAGLTATEYWNVIARMASKEGRSGARHFERERDYWRSVLHFDPPETAMSTYSHGMLKKTQLIGAMQLDRGFRLLDEPANGLDNQSWADFISALKFTGRGRITLIASHNIDWADKDVSVWEMSKWSC